MHEIAKYTLRTDDILEYTRSSRAGRIQQLQGSPYSRGGSEGKPADVNTHVPVSHALDPSLSVEQHPE